MIVDFHAHVYPDWIQKDKEKYLEKDQTFKDLFSDPKSKMADVDKLIKDMDEDGVDISVIMGIGWTDTGLAREMNDSTRAGRDLTAEVEKLTKKLYGANEAAKEI